MYLSDDEVEEAIDNGPLCEDFPKVPCSHCRELMWALDLQDARTELAELRAWRKQVFLVVRQIESTLSEHHRIVESLKK